MIFLIFILTLWNAWLLFITFSSRNSANSKNKVIKELPTCLVVIPAHNEEKSISNTLSSIKESSKGLDIKIVVLADNCTDTTSTKVQLQNIDVFERNDDTKRGKSYALEWFIDGHKELINQYETVCIVDADSTLSNQFFHHSLTYFKSHACNVAQTFYTNTINDKYSISAHSLELAHHVRQKGLEKTMGTSLLKGNGMIFKSSVLTEIGWHVHSITEDLEMSYYLLDKDININYIENATVYGDFSEEGASKSIQQKRWEGGRLQTVYKNIPKLMLTMLKKRSLRFLGLALDLSTPPLTMLLSLNAFMLIISVFTLNTIYVGLVLLNITMFISYVKHLPRKEVYLPNIKESKLLFDHVVFKLHVFLELFTKGVPKSFQRTPRS